MRLYKYVDGKYKIFNFRTEKSLFIVTGIRKSIDFPVTGQLG